MASFLGIGAGILFGRDPRPSPFSPFALLFLATTFLIGSLTLHANIPTDGEILIAAEESQAANPGFLVLALIVMLASLVMTFLAMPLGRLLTSMPPLRAYAIDIAGSMTGIVAFTGLSGLGTPPAVWFGVAGLCLALLALGAGVTRFHILNGSMLAAAIVLVVVQQPAGTSWSAYYRVGEHPGDVDGISVNGIPHQTLWPQDDPRKEPFYEQVYAWFPDRTFDDVLIVGAGSGSDVSVAVARGASHVDAVEIDARLMEIGQRSHPDRPYDDPRVTRHVDDGRAFLRRSGRQYDLVVFALPDSLTLVSTSANIRLESFLFTVEAFESVRDHLKPDGIFVLYNYYREPWLVEKLTGMLATAFQGDVVVRTYPGGSASAATIAAGPAIDALAGAAPPGDRIDLLPLATVPRPAVDDWPFLYLAEASVPVQYLIAIGLVLLWAVALIGRAARRSGTPLRGFSPHFFVLGVAFLLLETRSIVTFSLLFGATWLVNALVFFAVLASVLLAVVVASRIEVRRPWILYVGLLVTIAVAYLLPPSSLLIDPVWLRYVLAAAVAFAPVFLANLVFSYSFRDTRTADMAFASNLLGAMVGGAIEYLALIAGYQALMLVVAALYVAAYVLATRRRMLADVQLEPSRRAIRPALDYGQP
jgi:SAM-dependent methyltransferase